MWNRLLKSGSLALALVFPWVVSAMPADHCASFPFLKHGWNQADYLSCHQALQVCNPKGLDRACINKVVAANESCHQLYELSEVLDATPDVVTAEPAANQFVVIKHFYRADAQSDYAFISPNACLVKPKLYPLDYNRIFKTHRKVMDFFPLVNGEPSYQVRDQGIQSFTLPLEVRHYCVACEVLGYAKLRVDFTEKGKYIQTVLEP